MEAPPRVEDVLEFLIEHGFASAASALREDVLASGSAGVDFASFDGLHGSGPPLPPLRIASGRRSGGYEGGASSSSSDDFVSMGSSLSDLLNPYGVWSPVQPKSEDSSVRHSEFGTARDYNDPNIFSDSCWYDDQFGSYLNGPFPLPTKSSGCHSEDKFVMTVETEEEFKKQESRDSVEGELQGTSTSCVNDKPGYGLDVGTAEMFSCSFPLCDCCSGEVMERARSMNSSSAIYGRYQIMADETERLDEYGEDGFQLKKVDECPEAITGKGNSVHGLNRVREEKSLKLGSVEMEFQAIDPYAVDGPILINYDAAYGQKSNGITHFEKETNNDELGKGDCNDQLFSEKASQLDAKNGYGLGKHGQVDREFRDSGAVENEGEDHGTVDELQLYTPHEDEYEIFDLRIIHRKNRTGFEENKDFPIVLNSVIAGRYYVTEYLGSAAFSKVVQAIDLQTGMDVCLKIIKNDKDFFDQSLDEIKLLKFVNKYDPADECHLLRLYDYFYHQEHLFIVCELLRANLYEFQKYNQDSGGEVYFTLPRIQAITRQCLEALEYLHHLRIIHCDLKPENILIKSYSRCEIKIIDLGSSCFQTDNLSLYVQSRSYRAPEVILGVSYDEKIDIWSLGCILVELYTGEVLFTNESLVMILARIIGMLGPIDMEMLVMGQETHKYFTGTYDLYHRNEEKNQVEHLIPEKSSLARHLQGSDTAFIDFLSCLLQINPKMRPTASQALQHRWLSFPYK